MSLFQGFLMSYYPRALFPPSPIVTTRIAKTARSTYQTQSLLETLFTVLVPSQKLAPLRNFF